MPPGSAVCFSLLVAALAAPSLEAGGAAAPPCEVSMSVAMHYVSVFGNGSVWDPVGGSLYPPGTYWLDGRKVVGGLPVVYRGCPCMLARPCLRKCCPVGEFLDEDGWCVPSETHLFSPNVTDDDGSDPRTVDADDSFGVLFGLKCGGMVMVDPGERPRDQFFVRASDGSLSLPLRNVSSVLTSDFCLDYVSTKGAYLPLLCDRANQGLALEGVPEWLTYALSLVLLLSTSFLLVTLFAFALTPDLRKSLHGKSVMCLIICLIMGYVFLAKVQLAGKVISKNSCIASGYILQFSFQAAFFWLNAMCFDSCWVFRRIKPNPSLVAKREEKRFTKYSIYAWGLPLVIVFIAVVMDFYPHLPVHLIRPKFGQARCWFFTRGGALIYFYTPMAIVLLYNVIILAVTAVKITKGKKEPAILRIAGNMYQR